ncbi:hypothetical protein Esti_003547 [Eimeria stiedai]
MSFCTSPLASPSLLRRWQQPLSSHTLVPLLAGVLAVQMGLETMLSSQRTRRRSLWRGGPREGQGFEGSSKDQEVSARKPQETETEPLSASSEGDRGEGCACAADFSQPEDVLLFPTHCEASAQLAAFAREWDGGLQAAAEAPLTKCREVPGVPGAEPVVECCIFKLPQTVSDFTCEASTHRSKNTCGSSGTEVMLEETHTKLLRSFSGLLGALRLRAVEAPSSSADGGQACSRSHKQLRRLKSTRTNQVGATKIPPGPLRQRQRQAGGLALQGGARSTREAHGKLQQPHVASGTGSTKGARSAEAGLRDLKAQEKAAPPPPPLRRSRLQQHKSGRSTRTHNAPSSTSSTIASPPPTRQQLLAAKAVCGQVVEYLVAVEVAWVRFPAHIKLVLSFVVSWQAEVGGFTPEVCFDAMPRLEGAKARQEQQKPRDVPSVHREKLESCSSSSSSKPVHALLRRLTQLRYLQGLPPPLFCSCLPLPPTSSPALAPQRGLASASLSTKGGGFPPPAPRTPVPKPPPRGVPQLGDGGRGPYSAAHAHRTLNAFLQAVADTHSGHAVYVWGRREEERICPQD